MDAVKLTVLDPRSEHEATAIQLAPRLAALAGAHVGFISNGKEGTKGFFAHLETLLKEAGVASVTVRTKTNYSAPAEPAIIDEARNWDIAITGIGD